MFKKLSSHYRYRPRQRHRVLYSNSDSLLDVSIALSITDDDSIEASFILSTMNGNYRYLNIDISVNCSYISFNNLPAIQSLNTLVSLTDNLIVSSIDGTTHNITITINGVMI